MNIHDREIPLDEQRWQAQERARRGDPDADATDLRIARALRHAPSVDLPVDFASRVAALARTQATFSAVLEQRLLRGLVLVFALSAAVVVAWFGRGWVAELATVLPGGQDAVAWSGIATLCVLGNWGVGLLRGRLASEASAA
ncbi:MAG TPA: hypothetical protein PLI83_00360 [Thermomonas sp.]|jgi:predicted membrane protein|uniref:hypothetical protein n=1 Tax=Thermomonas sp. TaxID=1971895 RepID=UPI002D047191|nr:hypothetical protein [Thermomonas sp.]HOU66359.1 hypothetical protein [Thermomonas sp.]HOZ23216.1 hypothetical protein [Thermomonas sp.]HPM55715.1 hypothetical protein [Thermomonas sp.]HPW11863.1 hypothetical protein [Thermomonas sp.]